MSKSQILERERRWQLVAGICAILIIPLYILSTSIENSASVFDFTLPTERLRAADADSGTLLLAIGIRAISFLLYLPPLLYLFRAAQARSPRVSPAMVGFVFLGPILFAAWVVVSNVAQTPIANDFVAQVGQRRRHLQPARRPRRRLDDRERRRQPLLPGGPRRPRRDGLRPAAGDAGRAVDADVRDARDGVRRLAAADRPAVLAAPARRPGSRGSGSRSSTACRRARPPAWDAAVAIPWPSPGDAAESAADPPTTRVVEGDATELFARRGGDRRTTRRAASGRGRRSASAAAEPPGTRRAGVGRRSRFTAVNLRRGAFAAIGALVLAASPAARADADRGGGAGDRRADGRAARGRDPRLLDSRSGWRTRSRPTLGAARPLGPRPGPPSVGRPSPVELVRRPLDRPLRLELGFPGRVHGKVFLTLDGADYVCSATAVSSPSHTLAWTAGHCVHGADFGAGFATNWMFVPGYVDGQRPFGSWVATSLADHRRLGEQRQRPLRRRRRGPRPRRAGARDRGRGRRPRDRASTQPRGQTFDLFGYPAEDANTFLLPPNFDGQRLFSCHSAADRRRHARAPQIGPGDDGGGVRHDRRLERRRLGHRRRPARVGDELRLPVRPRSPLRAVLRRRREGPLRAGRRGRAPVRGQGGDQPRRRRGRRVRRHRRRRLVPAGRRRRQRHRVRRQRRGLRRRRRRPPRAATTATTASAAAAATTSSAAAPAATSATAAAAATAPSAARSSSGCQSSGRSDDARGSPSAPRRRPGAHG